MTFKTFNRIKSGIEDNGLGECMEVADGDETLSLHEAKEYYYSIKID